MNVKPIVKIMNFHALLRVDSSKRKAEKLRRLENEVLEMIDLIVNNKNFILDSKIMNPNSSRPKLTIYIGSDLGFCGNINTSVMNIYKKDIERNTKIIIGKKLQIIDDANLEYSCKEMNEQDTFKIIHKMIVEGIENNKFSKINLVYNHYHNASRIEIVEKTIYPIEKNKVSTKKYAGDFVVEGETEEILINIISTYLLYEIKIAMKNSYASENILRESTTSQSLKKIDEIEEEKNKEVRKKNIEKANKKVLENFMKAKWAGGENYDR